MRSANSSVKKIKVVPLSSDDEASVGFGSLNSFLNPTSNDRRSCRSVRIKVHFDDDQYCHRRIATATVAAAAPADTASAAGLGITFGSASSALGRNRSLNSNPFYCDTSITNSTLCGRKQLQMEDRARSSRSIDQALRVDPEQNPLQSNRDNLATYLKKRVSTAVAAAAASATTTKASSRKTFDYSKVDRSSITPYYGNTSQATQNLQQSEKYAYYPSRKISAATPQLKSLSPNKLYEGEDDQLRTTSYLQLTQQNGRMRSPIANEAKASFVNVENTESRTLAYENYIAKMLKTADETQQKVLQNQIGVIDNYIEVKLNRTQPVIFGLSQNYRALHAQPDPEPTAHDYKRHKMKKSQLLVRSVVKFIEQERQTVQLSNYDKSFSRLKENIVPEGSAGSSDVELASFEKNLIKTLTQRRRKDSENANDDHIASLREKFNRKEEARKDEERRDKIRRGIAIAQEKQEKEAIKDKIHTTARLAKLLHRHSIVTWANTHKLDGLESVQKYKECLNDPEKLKFERKPIVDEAAAEVKKASVSAVSGMSMTSPSAFKLSTPKPVQKRKKIILSLSGASNPNRIDSSSSKSEGKKQEQAQEHRRKSHIGLQMSSSFKGSKTIAARESETQEENKQPGGQDEGNEDDRPPQFKSQSIMKKVIELGKQNQAAKVRSNPNRLKNVFINSVQNLVSRPRGGFNPMEDQLSSSSQFWLSSGGENSSRGFLNRQRSVSFASSSSVSDSAGMSSMLQVASHVLNSKRAASKLITILSKNSDRASGTSERMNPTNLSIQQAQKEFLDGLEAVISDINAGGYV